MKPSTTKILIVDDDPDIRDWIRTIISTPCREILTGRNGRMACAIAKSERPDLIIMDWQMPEMNGLDVLHNLAQNEFTAKIPVIMMTGVMMQENDLALALDNGAIDYLRKPLNECELKARVRSVFRLKQQEKVIRQMLVNERNLISENLKRKERELASKSMFDHQRDELLHDLLNQVGRLDRITNHVHATNILPITRELKSQLNLEKDWQQFNKHFEEVHPGFFDKLLSRYRALTQKDCKLCAYIRMGMGNSEIANFTHVAKGSVERALNRLKKKLGLSETQNLREFILAMQ